MPQVPSIAIETGTAPLEGNYTTYTFQWVQTYAEGVDELLIGVNETSNKIMIATTFNNALVIRDLDTGNNPTAQTILNGLVGSSQRITSILNKYSAVIINNAGVPNLLIYKNVVLIQTIDLSLPPISWANTAAGNWDVSFSPDGKYILVDSNANTQYALFKGS